MLIDPASDATQISHVSGGKLIAYYSLGGATILRVNYILYVDVNFFTRVRVIQDASHKMYAPISVNPALIIITYKYIILAHYYSK